MKEKKYSTKYILGNPRLHLLQQKIQCYTMPAENCTVSASNRKEQLHIVHTELLEEH